MFNGSNIIITGGSSGVGKVLSQKLARKGANLGLIARDQDKLDSCKKELESIASGAQRIEIQSADVADFDQVETAIAFIADSLGAPGHYCCFSFQSHIFYLSCLYCSPLWKNNRTQKKDYSDLAPFGRALRRASFFVKGVGATRLPSGHREQLTFSILESASRHQLHAVH